MSITHTDPVATFLASKPGLGLSPDVYVAEKATSQAVLAPQLEYSVTRDQLEPDAREKAVERVLEVAGDYGFPMDLVVDVLAGFRPVDMTAAEIRDEVYHLLDLAADVRRASTRGDHAVEEMFAERYCNALADFAGGAR